MEILLLILKIIGIVLLALLGLLLFSILVVLFVPVRYRFYAGYLDKEPDVTARVSWLLHILHISLKITKDNKSCIIRIFGIPIMDIFHPKPKKKKPVKNKKSKRTTKAKKKKKTDDAKSDINPDKNNKKDSKQTDIENIPVESIQTEPAQNISAKQGYDFTASDLEEAETDKKGFFEKISEFIKKITELLASIPDKISSASEKLKSAKEKGNNAKSTARKWITVLKRDKTKKAIECAKDLIIWLLKKLLPKKWNAYIRFGFKDPATTAQILGYYWMFIGILSDRLVCQPEFEKEIIEGNINIKGHIRALTFVIVGWKVLFDPNLKYLRKIKAEVDSL